MTYKAKEPCQKCHDIYQGNITTSSYYNWSLLRTQAGGLRRFFVLQLLRRLSTDLNEIGHGQSVWVREHRRGVGILKFGTVAMEI